MKNIKKKYLIIATLLVMSLVSIGIISYAINSANNSENNNEKKVRM
ncbi:MAG: hypothetical protein JJE17_10875 [Peptostreptococcaceae bacterium]|nr:hypothetical protein [Peptostreptococcaceae bacterium]